MSERPIARLSYFDGQRLEASDLLLEQEYHIRIQRWLSRSLFSPGVAEGLEVFPAEQGYKVLVTPGLALDDLGRAIVLVAPVTLVPQARFLVVRYAERTDGIQQDGCRVRGDGLDRQATWGGPARVVSEPEFVWRRGIPSDDTRELVIADLQLDAACAVLKVQGGPRRVAVATQLTRVRPITFEGEKDLDQANPKVIRFFVKDRRPTSVTLHLQSRQLSTLYYTELGYHSHAPSVSGQGTQASLTTLPASTVDDHKHGNGTLKADDDPSHGHSITADVWNSWAGGNAGDRAFVVVPHNGVSPIWPPVADLFRYTVKLEDDEENFQVSGGTHGHAVSGDTGSPKDLATALHTHSVDVSASIGYEGSSGPAAVRGGTQLRCLSDLSVTVDGTPCKAAILEQIQNTSPSAWGGALALGNGAIPPLADPLRDRGTGPIRLDLLDGLSFDEGPHEIVLSVTGAGNGGCIQYNLYVE